MFVPGQFRAFKRLRDSGIEQNEGDRKEKEESSDFNSVAHVIEDRRKQLW